MTAQRPIKNSMNILILSGRSCCHLKPQKPVASDEWRISCPRIDAFQYFSIPYVQQNCIYRKTYVPAHGLTPGWHISDHQHGLLQWINLLHTRFSEWTLVESSCFLLVLRAVEHLQQRNVSMLTHGESHIISVRSIWDHFRSTLQSQASPALCPCLQTSPAHLWSEDADSLRETLDICILPSLVVRSQRGGRRHEVGGVRQHVLLGEGLPAAVVALVGDVTLAQLRLQLPQVQPCLIVLRNSSEKRGWGYSCRHFGSQQMGFYCVYCASFDIQHLHECQ